MPFLPVGAGSSRSTRRDPSSSLSTVDRRKQRRRRKRWTFLVPLSDLPQTPALLVLLLLLHIPPISLNAAVDNSSASSPSVSVMNSNDEADVPERRTAESSSNSSSIDPSPSSSENSTTPATTPSGSTLAPSSSTTPSGATSPASATSYPPSPSSTAASSSSSSSFHHPNQYQFHAISVAEPHRCFRTGPTPTSPPAPLVVDADAVSLDGPASCGDSVVDACCVDDAIAASMPLNPLLPCDFLSSEFVECDEPVDHKKNVTARDELGHGCATWGGDRWEDVERTKVVCRALDGIECLGPRVFFRDGYPCIRYTGHYFVTTLLYSILLGFLGMDRFCLGHMGSGVGKLLTIGGLGIWWLVDIVLLIQGVLRPVDDSNWEPLF